MRRLVETENKLKGSEATLEEVRDQLEGEKVGAAMLQTSLDQMKSSWEAEKGKVAGDAVTAYLQSEAFNDETIKYFISGFETLCHWILRVHPNFDLSMFKVDAESDSIRPKAAKGTKGELEKDDAASWG